MRGEGCLAEWTEGWWEADAWTHLRHRSPTIAGKRGKTLLSAAFQFEELSGKVPVSPDLLYMPFKKLQMEIFLVFIR